MVISRYADIKFATPRPLNIREWTSLFIGASIDGTIPFITNSLSL